MAMAQQPLLASLTCSTSPICASGESIEELASFQRKFKLHLHLNSISEAISKPKLTEIQVFPRLFRNNLVSAAR